MARDTLTREDIGVFNEISGYFKAHGETLVALRKVREGKYEVSLLGTPPFYGHLIRGEGHNIIDIERTES